MPGVGWPGPSGIGTRAWQGVVGAWGAVTGILPHVLHHIGPLAGAAVLAGVGGRVLFFLLGLAASLPLLRRLHRRFGSWVAPAVAVGVFVVMYGVSSLVIGPLITGGGALSPDWQPTTSTTLHPHGH